MEASAGLLILKAAHSPCSSAQLQERTVWVDTAWKPQRPPQPSASHHGCGDEDCPCLPIYCLFPEPGSVFSWALFCSKYEAFSSPGRPDLGKWRNHVAGAPAGCQAQCLVLRPACCSQKLRPVGEGPTSGQAGSEGHVQADTARQRIAGRVEVGPHVLFSGCLSEIQRDQASQALHRALEMGCVAW